MAVIYENTLLQKSIGLGALELARKRGLQVVLEESYAKGADFREILRKVTAANADVLAAASYETAVVTWLLKELDISLQMFGGTVEVAFPKF